MDPISYWLDDATAPGADRWHGDAAAELQRANGVDVLVVGAGMAGLCTAARLHEHGVSVAVVDAGEVGGRATGHTTAKITALHGLTYHQLRRHRGPDVAAAYASANQDAVAALRALVERWEIDCDLTAATAYTCAATDAGRGDIDAEAVAASAAGLRIRETTETDLPFEVRTAIALDDQAHFHPVRFARGVADHLRAQHVPVVEGARVVDITEDAHGCTVTFADGTVVTAARVVQTTHLPVTDPAFLAARARPERSYAVAGPAPTVPAGMYLTPDAGWSVRPADPQRRVCIVGGEDHAMVDDVGSPERYERLAATARELFGVDVTHRWSAFDYVPVDGLPFIGRLSPRAHRRFVATGFRKWGMSTSMVAAAVLVDLVDGLDAPYDGVFDATRLARNVGRDLVRTNAKVAVRFVGDRVRALRDVPDLAPGEGAVAVVRGERVAVSCDRSGTTRAVSAMCTHLGCVVRFNGADQVWDCPCHGSRFDLDGTVLDGPATSPLSPVPLDEPQHAATHDA